jgi:hypothetical protein
MTLFLEHIIYTGGIDWYPGSIVLSNGDRKGFSSHADFVMGWDSGFLQQVIDQCTDSGADLSTCELLMQTNNDNLARQCRPVKNLPLEDVGFYGPISRLLGDNAIWGDGIQKNSIGSTPVPPLVAPFSVTPNNWSEWGCIGEGDPSTNTMNGDKVVDQYMTPQQCVKNCDGKGFSMAGLENGKLLSICRRMKLIYKILSRGHMLLCQSTRAQWFYGSCGFWQLSYQVFWKLYVYYFFNGAVSRPII